MAEQAQYRYDVFVSYSHADADWVRDWLLPRLKDAGLEVCIDRDCFEPGAPVAEEIERAITQSRRTLAVLTPDWVESEWTDFEALLVQHHDPAARYRRLIPLLLKPADLPERIQMLHWVEFTQVEEREDELERVVAAIQGISDLPELRPDAIPSPAQRRWERSWMAVVGVAALLSLALLAVWMFSQRPARTMPEGSFNIAVAQFGAKGETGQPASSGDARALANSVARYLNSQSGQLEPFLRQEVTIWGPEQKVRPVADGEAVADRATDLNADVLLYGDLRQQNRDIWQLEPAFYLSEEVVSRADELQGEHALGIGIPYRPNSTAAIRDANTALQVRLKALVQMIVGLSYFTFGTQEGYQQAADVFQEVAADPEWGAAEDGTGQEIVYLFLGSAYQMQLPYTEDGSAAQSELLQESRAAYQKAIELNAAYPRSYNGLGTVLFHTARPPATDFEAECDWDWDLLTDASEAYGQALSAPEEAKPVHAYVDRRAQAGLGQIYFWRGHCIPGKWPGAWDTARNYYDAVVTEYQADPTPFLGNIALVAHTDLGHMAYLPAAQQALSGEPLSPDHAPLLAEAIQHYSQAVELADTEEEFQHAVSLMPYLLHAYCLDGQGDQAGAVLDDFVAGSDAPEAVRDWVVTSLRAIGACRGQAEF